MLVQFKEFESLKVTTNILEMLLERGPELGKAFCNVDPDRNYFISKEQFANALGTACTEY